MIIVTKEITLPLQLLPHRGRRAGRAGRGRASAPARRVLSTASATGHGAAGASGAAQPPGPGQGSSSPCPANKGSASASGVSVPTSPASVTVDLAGVGGAATRRQSVQGWRWGETRVWFARGGGGTRRAHLVRGEGRDVSSQYGARDETCPFSTGQGRDVRPVCMARGERCASGLYRGE